MIKIFYFMKLLINLIQIAKDSKNTKAAISVADALYSLGMLKREGAKIAEDAASLELIKSRYMMPRYELEKLKLMPTGSLAHAYANHMLSQNLQPDFYENIAIVNDATYIMMRLRETHDLWHVITGFPTTVAGELGLQAFMLAQVHTPLAPMLIGGRTLVSTFKDPKEVLEIYDSVAKGWILGANSKPIFSLDWEAHWGTSLENLRAAYGLVSALPTASTTPSPEPLSVISQQMLEAHTT